MITAGCRVLTALFISTLIASCAEGASLVQGLTDGGFGNAQPMCGNAMLESGEMCECPAGASSACLVKDKDCSALGAGTGPLLCDPATCMYVDDMCHSGTGGNGADGGASGSGGSGGTEG
jgi:hypothetical protein